MMRSITSYALFATSLTLAGCAHKGTNPVDPYEPFNRKIHNFNMAFDATMLKPPAKLYTIVVPGFARKGINNAFNNLDMLPTVANDLLQAEGKWAIKDSWRFLINSTLGVAGFIDVAEKFSLPAHYNDLGVTFAKWGDKQSPYLVLPFLGPSTIRDGAGMLFQFSLWTPYVYLNNDALMYSLLGLRYIDLRSQLFDSERIMNESLDKYSFIRDAYLQHRTYLITGGGFDNGEMFLQQDGQTTTSANADAPGDYVDE
jgi:phospholipid-binding lipoprotein MlaA